MSIELPQGWATTTLDKICSIITDGTHQTPKYVANGVPFLSTANIRPFSIGFDFSEYKRFISEEEHAALTKRCRPEIGDVLISKCGTIGRVKEVDVDFPFSIFVGLALLKFHSGVFRPKFAEFWLNCPKITNQFEELAPGTTRRTLTLQGIKSVVIPVPPLPEQHRIVAKLEKLLGKVDACQQRLAKIPILLKRFRQSVLAAACSGKLTEDWREGYPDAEPAVQLLERIRADRQKLIGREPRGYKPLVASEMADLPDSWVWANMMDLCLKIGDADHKMPHNALAGYPYVSTKDFQGQDDIDFDSAKRISQEDFITVTKKIKPRRGDILLSRYGTIGEVRKVKTDIEFQASYSIAIIKTLSIEPLTDFLILALRSELLQEQMRSGIQASSQPDLGLETIRQFWVPLPPLPEQQEIVRRVESLFALADNIEQRYRKAQAFIDKLTPSLLAKAFRGELLPQDPTDEPASVLLERIKAEREQKKPQSRKKR